MISLRAGSATDVGLVRSNNQDQFLVAHPLYAVADGMGGAAAGEVASALAVEALNNAFSRGGPPSADLLIDAARAANRAVWDQAEAHPEMRGMGTTLVALALVDGGQLAVANVGDSRLYGFHDGALRQITSDHNLVAEMVAEGRISKEEAEFHPRRNIMTRALGVEPDVPVDLFLEEAHPGDRFLLCSDGLPREVSDELIAATLRRLDDPQEAADDLVAEAKRRGGNDNITVVVVDVVEGPPGETPVPADGASAAAPTPALPMPEARENLAAGEATVAVPALGRAAPGDPAGSPEPAASRRRLWRPADDRPRAVTLRVVAFILVLLAVLAAGAIGVVWYARSAYFVGLRGDRIVIYQGRPGGVLWFMPTVADATAFTTADVLPSAVPALRAGQQEDSVAAAHAYVGRLVAQQKQAQSAGAPPSTAPATVPGPTSLPVTTVTPTTAGPPTPTTAPGAGP